MWGVRVLREAKHGCWSVAEWFILEVKGGGWCV